MNARNRQTIGIIFVAALVAFLLALIPMSCHAAPTYTSIARDGEFTTQLIGDSVTCDGRVVAILMKGAETVDKTCNVRFTLRGVSILFPKMNGERVEYDSRDFATFKLHD